MDLQALLQQMLSQTPPPGPPPAAALPPTPGVSFGGTTAAPPMAAAPPPMPQQRPRFAMQEQVVPQPAAPSPFGGGALSAISNLLRGGQKPLNGAGVSPRDTLREFLGRAMAGAAKVDPRSPGISAFAQGYAGTQAYDARKKADAEAKVIADEERAAKREERAFDRKMKEAENRRAEAAGGRAGRAAEVSEIKTLTEIMKDLDGTLTADQRIKISTNVTTFGKNLLEAGLPADEVMSLVEQRRDEEVAFAKGEKPATAAAPQTGDGTSRENPVKFSPGKERQAFEALPSGAWFINPADGQLLQKR